MDENKLAAEYADTFGNMGSDAWNNAYTCYLAGFNAHKQNLLQTQCTTQLPADTWIEDDYCKCENPTLGTNLTRCGTCNCWFKPIA